MNPETAINCTHGHFNQVAFAVIQVYFSGIATIALVSKS